MTARGIAVDLPGASSIVDDRVSPAAGSGALPPVSPAYEESRSVASRRWSRPVAIGGLIVGGLLLAFIATGPWFRSTDKVESSSGSRSASPGGAQRRRQRSTHPTSVQPGQPVTAATPPTGPPVSESTSPPTAAAEGRTTAASVSQPPMVAAAQLCRDLSTAAVTGSALPQAFQSVRARSSSTRESSPRRLRQSNIDGIGATACARWWSFPFSPTPQAAIARIAATRLTIRARVTGGSSSEQERGSYCTRSASSFADRFESGRCFTRYK